MTKLLLFCLLLVVCWPVAILALLLYPFVWMLLLPFRLVGLSVDALFTTLHTALTLPARMMERI